MPVWQCTLKQGITIMIKKYSMATALVLASAASPSHAGLIATWDLAAVVSGSREIAAGVTVNVIGAGSGGFATLDDSGVFSFSGLVMDVDADAGVVGGANATVGAQGAVTGMYNPVTQQLSNNMASIVLSEIAACDPYGLLGSMVCDLVPSYLQYDKTMVLSPAQGLTDPITFDLVNDFSFLMGNLGGVVALELTLSNGYFFNDLLDDADDYYYDDDYYEDYSEMPVPAAAWLFGSALMGLAGIKRRK